MLTPELVMWRRRAGELQLIPLSAPRRAEALALAEALLEVVRDGVGATRDELEARLEEQFGGESDRRLVEGLRKLVEDACEFEEGGSDEPGLLRNELFLAAARGREAAPDDAPFEPAGLLQEFAQRKSTTPEGLVESLYSDLRGAQRLRRASVERAEALVDRYDLEQRKAVLLRAVRVVATLGDVDPRALRALFQKLKFRRLLFRAERLEDGRLQLELDGPFSLFDSVTKYGLALALVLPELEAAGDLTLVAELKWGKAREPLLWRHRARPAARAEERASEQPEELTELVAAFDRLGSAWQVRPATELFELPGVGLCVPDLVFQSLGRPPVYLELLGYWSRDAVWRRVELVNAGLPVRVVFALSERLRVSAEVLPPEAMGALYAFKGRLRARAVLERVERLAERA